MSNLVKDIKQELESENESSSEENKLNESLNKSLSLNNKHYLSDNSSSSKEHLKDTPKKTNTSTIIIKKNKKLKSNNDGNLSDQETVKEKNTVLSKNKKAIYNNKQISSKESSSENESAFEKDFSSEQEIEKKAFKKKIKTNKKETSTDEEETDKEESIITKTKLTDRKKKSKDIDNNKIINIFKLVNLRTTNFKTILKCIFKSPVSIGEKMCYFYSIFIDDCQKKIVIVIQSLDQSIVEELYEIVNFNNNYLIENAKIRKAGVNRILPRCQEIELVISNTSQIQKNNEPNSRLKLELKFFTKIKQIEDLADKSIFNVIGIISEIGNIKSIKTKLTNESNDVLNVTIFDETFYSISCAFWKKAAEIFDENNFEVGDIIMIGNCKKSCYHNCTITVSEKTTMFVKMPENLKENEKLNKFSNRLTRMSDLKPLSWEY